MVLHSLNAYRQIIIQCKLWWLSPRLVTHIASQLTKECRVVCPMVFFIALCCILSRSCVGSINTGCTTVGIYQQKWHPQSLGQHPSAEKKPAYSHPPLHSVYPGGEGRMEILHILYICKKKNYCKLDSHPNRQVWWNQSQCTECLYPQR